MKLATTTSSLLLLILNRFINVFGDLDIGICEESFECEGDTIDDIAICVGYFACHNADIDASEVACTGAYGCYGADIVSDDFVICNGAYGCRDATQITAESYIFCNGYYACKDVENKIYTDSYVYCDGDYACADDTIEANTYAYCNGNYGCFGSSISAGDYVYCDGESSCAEGTLYSEDDIYCFGLEACEKAEITAIETILIDGRRSAVFATMTANLVLSRGYFSTAFAVIDSEGQEEMTFRSIGYFSGYGATFICRSDSACTLFCCGSGCNNLDYVCANGADCVVKYCDSCADNPEEISGVDLDEATLAKYLNRKVEERDHDGVYQKIKGEVTKEIKSTAGEQSTKALAAINIDGMILSGESGGIATFAANKSTYHGLLIALISSVITAVLVYLFVRSKYQSTDYAALK